MGMGLMAVVAMVMFLLMTQTPAQGAVDCATASGAVDTDSDGFNDLEECSGIPLADASTYPSCVGTTLPRSSCLDPDTKDLFVILVRASVTNIPANPLEFIPSLGVTPHEIDATQADPARFVTPTQKAIRITENLDTSDTYFGAANWGTPNSPDLAQIYTQRIINHIDSVCGSASSCKDSAGTSYLSPFTDLKNLYIKNTLAHESGHLMEQAPDYNRRFGGNHYKTGSGVIMDQSVKYTKKGTKVTYYIATEWSPTSQEAVTLK